MVELWVSPARTEDYMETKQVSSGLALLSRQPELSLLKSRRIGSQPSDGSGEVGCKCRDWIASVIVRRMIDETRLIKSSAL